MQDDLLTEGLTLMALGMGFVFVFLTLLVLTTSLMSWIIRRYFPQPQSPPQAKTPSRVGSDADTAPRLDDTILRAVIGAAVHRHRQRRR